MSKITIFAGILLCLLCLVQLIWGIVYIKKDEGGEVYRAGIGLIIIGILTCIAVTMVLIGSVSSII